MKLFVINKIPKIDFNSLTDVVYFDQHLGAAHSKCWSKYPFSHFLRKTHRKEE